MSISLGIGLGLTSLRNVGGGFSPAILFAGGEPGVWYDPSDLSTLFQDDAGTTPVTTPGQTVALMLDKSKGLTLGPELVTNGTFDDDADGWTEANGATATYSSGKMRVAGNGSTGFPYAFQSVSGLTVGKAYQVSGAISYVSGTSNAQIQLGAAALGFPSSAIASGQYSFIWICDRTSVQVRCLMYAANAVYDFDDVTFKEISGFHATQATTSARPTYGIVPETGRRNLLLNTDTLGTQSVTVAAVEHVLSFTGTGTVTLTGASIEGPLIGTGADDRVSLTFTPTAGALTVTVVGSVTLAQLERSSLSNYQRVGSTQFDVTEAGVPSLGYLSFDGVDDWMVTPTITPGIDKVQVFAGVRKLSDVAGIIAETSTTTSANAGSMYIASSESPTARYTSFSRGSALAVTGHVATITASGTAPDSAVLTATHDIAGDLSRIRRNGVAGADGTADKGLGNFLAYPMYIGRRAGTSISFNGHLHQLITRFGANLEVAQIESTEAYAAAKSGVTL